MKTSANVTRAEPCLCGATDCPRCYPSSRPEPLDRHLKYALEEVVEAVMDHGQWPVNGRAQFSIYDFLLNERDPSFPLELYVAAMSSNAGALADRIERERKAVEAMLTDHLSDSEFVYDLASEYAAEEDET